MSVESITAAAQAYAATTVSNAVEALGAATSAIERMGYTQLSFAGQPLAQPPSNKSVLTLPTFDPVPLDLPGENFTASNFQDIPPLDPGKAPTFDAKLPTYTAPTAPAPLAEFKGVAPTIDTNIIFPNPPAALTAPLPTAPSFTARDAPIKPNTTLPAFTATAPTDLPTAPTNLDTTLANAYSGQVVSNMTMVNGYVDVMLAKYNPRYSEQMAAIETQLAKYLAGGTALNSTVEDAIYSRAREKNEVEAKRVRDAAYSEAASRGFTLPSGALTSAVARARQDAANNNAKTSTDIAIAQAEMEQKNLQFAVSTSASLRTTLLNTAMAYMSNLSTINGQALDYAKSILGAVIEIYNSALKAYNYKVEAFKAQVAQYETQLKFAMMGIEVYQQEIAALTALTGLDRAQVDVYRARIESLTSLTGVYRAQVEAVMGRVALEKARIDMFQGQVQAFGAQVQAKNAEWSGYNSQIEGQLGDVKVYQAQVSAYSAEVQGYSAAVSAGSETVRAAALTNDARAKQYAAEVSRYSAVVEARGKVASTELENQRQSVVAFQALAQAETSRAQVTNEYYKATSMVGIENAKLSIAAQVSSAEIARAYGGSLAQIHTAQAQIYGNLAGAAVAGMNTLAAQTLASS